MELSDDGDDNDNVVMTMTTTMVMGRCGRLGHWGARAQVPPLGIW